MLGMCERNRDALRLSEISVNHIIVNYVGVSSEDIVTVLSDDGRRIIKSLTAKVYDLINREETSSLVLDEMIYDSYDIQLKGKITPLKELSNVAKTAELDGLTRRLVKVIESLCGNRIPLGVQHLLGKMKGACSFRDYGVLLISHPAIVDRAEFQGIVNRLYFNLKHKGRIKYLVGCMPNNSYPADWSDRVGCMSESNDSFNVFREVCEVSVDLKKDKDKAGSGGDSFYLTKFGLLTFLRELYAHGGDNRLFSPETLCSLVYHGIQRFLYHGHGRIITSTPPPMGPIDLVPGFTLKDAEMIYGPKRLRTR